MNIFYNSSLTGKKEYQDNYETIFKALEKTDHEIIGSPVMIGSAEAVIKESTKQAGNYAKKLHDWIKKADICVFEVSYPSTSIGYEVALALQMSKPVIALHVKDAPPNLVLETLKDDRLQLIDYTLDDIDSTVSDAVDYASEQMDTRFNFFISPEISNYLDWISKEKKTPRAVFLRQLIEEDMDNQNYNQ